MENKNKKEVKLVIFLDDDDSKKEKYMLILRRDEFGIKVQPCDKNTLIPLENASAFEIPSHRILKIKDIEVKDGSSY